MDESQELKPDQDTLSSNSFSILPEKCSLSSLYSGDESFVVLWKDGDNNSLKDKSPEPTYSRGVETESLIKEKLKEVKEIEELSLVNENKLQSESDLVLDGMGGPNEKKVTEEMVNIQQFDTSGVISITTLPNDLTPEELQKKISEIIEENVRLKDIILGNNKIMKLQYERITTWQKDVQNVHEIHKKKIIDAKEFIEKLKKENSNMCQELELVKISKNKQEQEINSLKQKLIEKEQYCQSTTDNSINETNLNTANKKVRELEQSIENLILDNCSLKEDKTKLTYANIKIQEYENEIAKLQAALDCSKKELEEVKIDMIKTQGLHEEKLKSFNEVVSSLSLQLLATNRQQEIENIQNELASTQAILTEMEQSRAEACAQIENLNKEILELKTKLEGSQALTDVIFALKSQLELYIADFQAEKSAKEAINADKEKLSEDLQTLQKRNQKLQEKIDLIRDNYYIVPRSQGGQGSSKPPPPSSPDDCFLQ